ncbi:MAG: 30S ribosome-binding factor RbfA [Candidatus Aminicenantia bacterium]
MRVSHRPERVVRLLKEELAKLIQRELKDPSIGFTTITDVVLSQDLKHAEVYITVFGEEEKKKKSLEVLNKTHGFIRKMVARDLNLRINPTLTFYLDDSFEKGETIGRILKEIQEENEWKEDS